MNYSPVYNVKKPTKWRRDNLLKFAKNVNKKMIKNSMEALYTGLAKVLMVLSEMQGYYKKDKSALKVIDSDINYFKIFRNELSKELSAKIKKSQPRVKKSPGKKKPAKKSPPQKKKPAKKSPPQKKKPAKKSPPQKKKPAKKSPPQKKKPAKKSPPQKKKPAKKSKDKQRKSQPRAKNAKMQCKGGVCKIVR